MQNNSIAWQKMDSIISLNKVNKNYLFYDQIEQIKNRCNNIVENKDGIRHESIIGIVGERGSGKSSLLHTVRENLQEFYVLDVLDPNVFDDSMSVLELFIGQIHKCVLDLCNDRSIKSYEEFYDNKCSCSNSSICNMGGMNESVIINLHQQLKEIIKLLSDYQGGKTNFYQNYTYGDLLENIVQRVKMPELIKNLVNDFLSALSCVNHRQYKGLVLCIDDVDLVSNDKVYSLLEDIRKYLAGNIIVITAYRSMQLFDAVLNEKLKENDLLLKMNSLSKNDVREQTARYLEKLIPVHNRVQLFDAEGLLQKPYYKIFCNIMEYNPENENEILKQINQIFIDKELPFDESGEMPIKQWLFAALNLRIRLKLEPIDKWENTVYNLPVNLRGLLQLIQLIVCRMNKLKLLRLGEDTNINERYEISNTILNNLKLYREYFYQGLKEILPVEFSNIIDLWQNSEYRAKNYLICDILIKKIQETDVSVLSNVPRYNLYQISNIAIGDVYNVIEIFKTVIGVYDVYRFFAYALKVLYSIELLSSYLLASNEYYKKQLGKSNDYNLQIYLTLINAKIVSNHFKYFTRDLWEGKIIFNGDTRYANDNTNLYKKLIYSTVALESDARYSAPIYNYENGQLIGSTKLQSQAFATLKYKKLYEYDIVENYSDLKKDTQYPIDPFAFLGQKWYVQNTFMTNEYVFYSMFDLDAIMKFDYGRGYRKEPLESFKVLLYKADFIITGEILGQEKYKKYEINLQKNMSDSILYIEEEKEKRKAIFTNELGEIIGISEIMLTKGSVDKLSKFKVISLCNKMISELPLETEEINEMELIINRLNEKGAMVRKGERYSINLILEKYKYTFDEDLL